mmetsp:Transcript_12054/g.43432  ORF Transcript_12054/g.43432 Transcript_12054/m.43432 type:complete len:127 (+) Transcript_12054:3350-3730(+)
MLVHILNESCFNLIAFLTKLAHFTINYIEIFRLEGLLHANSSCRFIEKVNSFVGKATTLHIARGKLRSGNHCRFVYFDRMMRLISWSQSTENRHSLRDVRFCDRDLLKATLKGSILFYRLLELLDC